MARWQDVVDSAPEFAGRVEKIFNAGKHKTIATLRKDGSPRISGLEAEFAEGHLWFGMLANSQKLRDVERDPRIALHSPSTEPPADPADSAAWTGDAKVSGKAVPMDESLLASVMQEGADGKYFTVDIEEVVLTRLDDPAEHLLIELWKPDQPLKTLRA
jgi:hypothetical protein